MANDFLRIGVLSDTHMPRKGKELPGVLVEKFKGVDLIIHAGDINMDHVLYELEEIAPVEAVAGNTDDEYIRSTLGTKKVIAAGGHRIGVVHGDGIKGTTLERARAAFKGENVSCVIFGHSHIPFNQVVEGILYFNPGSATDKRRQEKFSCGIITINGTSIEGKIVFW